MPEDSTYRIHRVVPTDRRQEDGTHELAALPQMEPYRQFMMAVIRGSVQQPELAAIRQMPLEERYVWRAASELKRALADCDDGLNIHTDRQTLSPEALARVRELLRFCPTQFCVFLKALVGVEEMQRMMVEAIWEALR